jgi:hypothetical protein
MILPVILHHKGFCNAQKRLFSGTKLCWGLAVMKEIGSSVDNLQKLFSEVLGAQG